VSNLPAAVSRPGVMPAGKDGARFSPVQMMEIELTEPLPAVRYDVQHQRAAVGHGRHRRAGSLAAADSAAGP
jgi:hypothetical protein